jgi:RecA-family ATPase
MPYRPKNKKKLRFAKVLREREVEKTREDITQVIEESEEEESEEVDLFDKEGGFFYDYMDEEIDESVYLLGKGYLEQEQTLMMFGPAGVGKSTAALQMSCCFAVGREAFNMEPLEPRRILIIQAEDTENDMRRMCKLGRRLNFTVEEMERLKHNLYIKRLNGPVLEEFFKYVEIYVQQWKPDLLIINPYSSYVLDVYDTKQNARFLRH